MELGALDVPVTFVLTVEVEDFVEDDEALTAPPAFRYQFADGSPRQVPTDTDWNPLAYIEARM